MHERLSVDVTIELEGVAKWEFNSSSASSEQCSGTTTVIDLADVTVDASMEAGGEAMSCDDSETSSLAGDSILGDEVHSQASISDACEEDTYDAEAEREIEHAEQEEMSKDPASVRCVNCRKYIPAGGEAFKQALLGVNPQAQNGTFQLESESASPRQAVLLGETWVNLCADCAPEHAESAAEVLAHVEGAGPFGFSNATRSRKQTGRAAADVRLSHNLTDMLLQRSRVVLPGDSGSTMLSYDGKAVPDLRVEFDTSDLETSKPTRFSLLATLRDENKCVVLSWGCGAGKSYRIFELLRSLFEKWPDMPVLFVSCRQIHASDLYGELEKLGFVCYLNNRSQNAEGMRARIREGKYHRVICSLQSARALPADLKDAFKGRPRNAPGLVVYDENVSTSAFIMEVAPDKSPIMRDPDESLDVLAEIGQHAMVLGSDGDATVHGGGDAFMRRVAPHKPMVSICANQPYMDIEVDVAFACPKSRLGPDGVKRENPTACAFWERLYAAVAAARARFDEKDGFPERVGIGYSTVSQMLEVETRLKERGLWCDTGGCKHYDGKSLDKADFKNTPEAWLRCYLVGFNSCCTVAINIELRFGSVFAFTSRYSASALCRDNFQGLVRFWRKQAFFPLDGGFNGGKRIVRVLLDCAPPVKIRTNVAEMGEWLQNYADRELDRLKQNTIHAGSEYNGARCVDGTQRSTVRKCQPGTLEIMAWNLAERAAQSREHLACFLYLAFHKTRGFQVKRLVPSLDQGPLNYVAQTAQTEDGERPTDIEARDRYNIKESDINLAPVKHSHSDVYSWFINDFRDWYLQHGESPAGFKERFFESDDGVFWELRDCGNGVTRQALTMVFFTLRAIFCFPESPVPLEEANDEDEAAPCPLSTLAFNQVALERQVHMRTFSEDELGRMQQHVEAGVRILDLVALKLLKQVLSSMQLELSDVFGVDIGGGWGQPQAPDCGELVPFDGELVKLDFQPRLANDTGSGRGKWAYAVDMHEELSDAPVTRRNSEKVNNSTNEQQLLETGLSPERRAVLDQARLTRDRLLAIFKGIGEYINPNTGLLVMLSGVLKLLYKIQLKFDRKKGKTKLGTANNQVIKGISRFVTASSLLPRWHVPLDVACPEFSSDDKVAACEFRIKAISARALRSQDDNCEEAVQTLSATGMSNWNGSGTSADYQASGTALHSLRDTVPLASDCERRVTVDVSSAECLVRQLTECTPTAKGAAVLDALRGVLCVLADGKLTQSSVRELEGRIGARVPVASVRRNALVDMPVAARDVLLGQGHALVAVETEHLPGCLLLKLVRNEAASGSLLTPVIDNVLRSVRAAKDGALFSTEALPGLEGLQLPNEKPISALRRATHAVWKLSTTPEKKQNSMDGSQQLVDDAQQPMLAGLVTEAIQTADGVLKDTRWKSLAQVITNKSRGTHGSQADRELARTKAHADTWRLLCNTLVDNLLCEVENALETAGHTIAYVDGRDPTWVRLAVLKAGDSLPKTLATKLVGTVRFREKQFGASGVDDIQELRCSEEDVPSQQRDGGSEDSAFVDTQPVGGGTDELNGEQASEIDLDRIRELVEGLVQNSEPSELTMRIIKDNVKQLLGAECPRDYSKVATAIVVPLSKRLVLTPTSSGTGMA